MATKLSDELNAMNKGLGEDVSTDEPETDAPETTTPTTEAPTEAPNTESVETEAPKTNAPETEVPTTEAPLDEKDKAIAELRAEIELLKKKPTPTQAPSTEAPFTVEEQDFVGDLDPADMTKEDLNKLLNKVFAIAAEKTLKTVRSTVPDTIVSTIDTREKMQKLYDGFYSTNEDLKPFQKVVGVVFGEVAAINKGKNIDELLALTGPEVRKRLNLPTPKPKAAAPKGENKPPRLPNRKGRSGSPEQNRQKPKGVEAEIADMTNALGR